MTEPHDQDPWLQKTRARLDAAEQDIDGATLGRLRAARREALAGVARKPPLLQRWVWLPAGGVALALALTVVPLGQDEQALEVAASGPDVLEDLELLGGEDSLDMIGELEFYLWIEQGGAELG